MKHARALILTIDKDGSVYLKRRRLTPAVNIDDLPRLSERLSKSKDRRVFVRGDGETPYRVIAYVLDQAKRAQASVSLVTEPSLKKQ